MKFFKSIKLLQKPIIIDILFYGHLTIGFLIASLVAISFSLDHTKVAFIWSLLFIYLLIEKTKKEYTK